MNPIDSTLQRSFPALMVPTRETVAPMDQQGERLLIASNGVFLEISRPWLRLVRQIAVYSVTTAIPYGEVAEVTELRCGPVPPALIAEFANLAQAAMPNETGAWIVWSEASQMFRLVPLPAISRSAGHLNYERPELRDGEVLVVDAHSHGAAEAFFSRTDDADDRHDVKLAFVLGNCGSDRPSMALRLCAKGIFEKSSIPGSWRQAVADREVTA